MIYSDYVHNKTHPAVTTTIRNTGDTVTCNYKISTYLVPGQWLGIRFRFI